MLGQVIEKIEVGYVNGDQYRCEGSPQGREGSMVLCGFIYLFIYLLFIYF